MTESGRYVENKMRENQQKSRENREKCEKSRNRLLKGSQDDNPYK